MLFDAKLNQSNYQVNVEESRKNWKISLKQADQEEWKAPVALHPNLRSSCSPPTRTHCTTPVRRKRFSGASTSTYNASNIGAFPYAPLVCPSRLVDTVYATVAAAW